MTDLKQLLSRLRNLGFDISTAESIEAHKMLMLADSEDELRLGIRMIVAHSLQEQQLFDMLWQNTYNLDKTTTEGPELPQIDGEDTQSFPINPPEMGNDIDYCPNPPPIAAGATGSNDPSINLYRFASDMKSTTKQLLQGNTRNSAAILLRYLLSNSYNLSEMQNTRDQAIQQIEHMLDDIVPEHTDNLVERLEDRLNQLMAEELDDPRQIGRHPMKIQDIEELPLMQLKPSTELQQALKRLGNKLASRHRRKIKRGRNKINLRRTIRSNIQHGGVLLDLKREKPRLDRPKLTILTDVSSSTIRATKMFLTIIWHAKEVFSDIRFYEFIGNMIDVTAELRRADSPEAGIEAALQRWEEQTYGKENSDYYTAFRKYTKLRGKTLSNKDSIILLGDLRDWMGPWRDGKPLSAAVMGKIARKVKRFIVLNPESTENWNNGDSIVRFVEQHDIEVYEATTLEKLIDVLLTL